MLDLTHNRLRKIQRHEVGQYSNLLMLYLEDNFLVEIEEDTFSDLTNLLVLDLGLNSIATLPSHILHLPSLEKLYLRRNQDIKMERALRKSISSPLNYLDISYTTDEDNIPEFPNLGILPHLLTLNISGNMYSSIKPKHFAGFCRLSLLLAANVSGGYDDPCDCWRINTWFTSRGVQLLTPLPCSIVLKCKTF